jgi:hypothetical protein
MSSTITYFRGKQKDREMKRQKDRKIDRQIVERLKDGINDEQYFNVFQR